MLLSLKDFDVLIYLKRRFSLTMSMDSFTAIVKVTQSNSTSPIISATWAKDEDISRLLRYNRSIAPCRRNGQSAIIITPSSCATLLQDSNCYIVRIYLFV